MTHYIVPDLTDRIAIVTGATSGIGLWTAVGLAKANATVVITGRDKAKAEKAKSFIQDKVKKSPDVELADFESLKAVDALATRLGQRYGSIHILINNAGLFAPKRELTVDDYERTFAVNHLAPFCLTNRLLEHLIAAGSEGKGQARIVTVASEAARGAKIDFDDLMSQRRYSMLRAYSQSKLANMLFTKELSRHLVGQPVTTNSLHPGVVATQIGNRGGVMGVVWSVIKPFLMTAEQGATNSLYVATSPEIENTSGDYFVKQKPKIGNPLAADAGIASRLWAESERLVAAALA